MARRAAPADLRVHVEEEAQAAGGPAPALSLPRAGVQGGANDPPEAAPPRAVRGRLMEVRRPRARVVDEHRLAPGAEEVPGRGPLGKDAVRCARHEAAPGLHEGPEVPDEHVEKVGPGGQRVRLLGRRVAAAEGPRGEGRVAQRAHGPGVVQEHAPAEEHGFPHDEDPRAEVRGEAQHGLGTRAVHRGRPGRRGRERAIIEALQGRKVPHVPVHRGGELPESPLVPPERHEAVADHADHTHACVALLV
mmetsp:Transcript_2999/g.9855  ORF Transcript_2999/g.9855 Transcript_2999/m.9855 type:complete len:248 (-) Transcript_2999:372-1115(-)